MPVVAPEPSEWDRFAGLPAGDPVPLDTVDEIRALRARLVIGNILTRNEWAAIPLAMDRLLAMHDEVVAALREARAERDAFLAALGAIATLPSASIAVRDIARHALLNGGAS